MKTKTDPRHEHRQKLVKELFEWDAHQKIQDERYKIQNREAAEIVQDIIKIDDIIEKNAGKWPKDKINNVDIAILRLAVYEISQKQTPKKVVIDEAVELAKEFGGDSSPKFVNGVLNSITKDL